MPNSPQAARSSIFQFSMLAFFILLTIACTPEIPAGNGRIGGGQGDAFVLECSTEQPCPKGYECIAVQETKGNCRQQV